MLEKRYKPNSVVFIKWGNYFQVDYDVGNYWLRCAQEKMMGKIRAKIAKVEEADPGSGDLLVIEECRRCSDDGIVIGQMVAR